MCVCVFSTGILCFIAYALDTSDPSNLYLGIVLEGGFSVLCWDHAIVACTHSLHKAQASAKSTGGLHRVLLQQHTMSDVWPAVCSCLSFAVVTLVTGTFSFYQEAKSNAIMQVRLWAKQILHHTCGCLRNWPCAAPRGVSV